MRRRIGILALLVFQAIWLNVIVPGHTRGVVTLAGSSSGDQPCHEAAKTACCPTKGTPPGHDSKQPTQEQKAHCAVCYFAARITPPPPVDLLPSPLEYVQDVVVALPASADSSDTRLTYWGRGPPLA